MCKKKDTIPTKCLLEARHLTWIVHIKLLLAPEERNVSAIFKIRIQRRSQNKNIKFEDKKKSHILIKLENSLMGACLPCPHL